MSLKIKFLKQIFPPLILSIFLTATISTCLIMFYHDSTVSISKDSILHTEKSDMNSFAGSITSRLDENLKALINKIEMILSYAENLDMNLAYNNQNNYLISAYSIANKSILLQNLTGFDDINHYNYDYAMWSIPGNPNFTLNINNSSNMTNKQKQYSFFKQMDIFLRSIFFSNPNYKLIYGFFGEDSLQYAFPSYENSGYINFISNDTCEYTSSGKTEFFDMRCRPYGKEINKFMKSPNLTNSMMISHPYLYLKSSLLGLTICGYNIKNSTMSNFTLIPPEERKLNYAFCIDFEVQNLVSFQELFELKELYYYVLFKDQVFYHPYFLRIKDLLNFHTITEYEFEVLDSLQNQESVNFNNTVMKEIRSFYEGCDLNSSTFEYKKHSIEYIAKIEPIYISKTGENANLTGLLGIIVEPKNLIFQKFDQTAVKTMNFIILQVIIFMVIMLALVIFTLFLINFTVKSIITPITDLCEVVKSMTNDDLDADVTKNYTPNSEEINQLYQSFSKLKFIMKYANEEFFSGNDAQALINYSNALNLYLELNQKEGIGVTYNNIGNIHLKNERYAEAIACYRLAVKTIEEELDNFFKSNAFRQTIFIRDKPIGDLELQESKKIYLPRSRRRKDQMNSTSRNDIPLKKQNQLNEMYSNRLYQLATTLYTQVMKENQQGKWEEIITIFKKIIEVDTKIEANNSRIIHCLIYIANSYLEAGEQVASLKYLNEAENSISIYDKVEKFLKLPKEVLKNLEDTNDPQIQKKIMLYRTYKEKFQGKADILKQRLMYYYGLFYKKLGKYKQACIMLTKSIEIGKIYDPFIRKKCLESLSNILAQQNLLQKAPNITNLLARMDDENHKDIVFLLDYSESMGKGARIQYAIRNFAKIFDKYIKDNDKLCFIRFDLNCEIVFALTHKKTNTSQLRKHIENSLHPTGKTAFYDALEVAINQFTVYNEFETHEKRRKWIVSLTDGEDNSSLLSLKIIKNKLKTSDINLIIVGMGLSKNLTKDLKDLCKFTKDGAFIESPNNDDLDVAFEAISQTIYGQNLIVESF